MLTDKLKRYVKQRIARYRCWLNYCGTKVHYPKNSHTALRILDTGVYEPEITKLLVSAASHGSWMIDVGANIGVSAIPVLASAGDVTVVSIEASPKVFTCLARTHNDNAYRSRWHLVNAAASNNHGGIVSFTVHQSSGDVYDGIIDTGRAPIATMIEVNTTSVDQIWKSHGKPYVSVIKVDTEGAEIQVLEGAKDCITACRPKIVTEWCTRNFIAYGSEYSDMFKLAQRHEYDMYAIPYLSLIDNIELLRFALELQENLLLLPRMQGS